MFTGNTDPLPYITAAYLVGAMGIFGIMFWIFKERSDLTMRLRSLRSDDTESK
jgi:hypothetical protein